MCWFSIINLYVYLETPLNAMFSITHLSYLWSESIKTMNYTSAEDEFIKSPALAITILWNLS